MSIRLAALGLDDAQADWLQAVQTLASRGSLTPVAAGHHSIALAREFADPLGVPPYDDPRKLLLEASPQAILLDRPENVPLEFLLACLQQNIGLFCLGPPVASVAEARALADLLEPVTHLLYVWPRLAAAPVWRHAAQADEFVRPVKFAVAQWYAFNHPLAKTSGQTRNSVRSLSVLAWDAFSTLIDLMGLPESLYASLRGTGGRGDNFADLSGTAALTLRFAEAATASLTLSDRLGPWRRELLLVGQEGTLELSDERYLFADNAGKLIDQGCIDPALGGQYAAAQLQDFLDHLASPPSPHRGWPHRLEQVASAMEAMLVSQRTGQAESPERFLALRR